MSPSNAASIKAASNPGGIGSFRIDGDMDAAEADAAGGPSSMADDLRPRDISGSSNAASIKAASNPGRIGGWYNGERMDAAEADAAGGPSSMASMWPG